MSTLGWLFMWGFLGGVVLVLGIPFTIAICAAKADDRCKQKVHQAFATIKKDGLWYAMETIVDGKHYTSEDAELLAVDWTECGEFFVSQTVLLRLPSGQFAKQTHYSHRALCDNAYLLTPQEAAALYYQCEEQRLPYETLFASLIEEA